MLVCTLALAATALAALAVVSSSTSSPRPLEDGEALPPGTPGPRDRGSLESFIGSRLLPGAGVLLLLLGLGYLLDYAIERSEVRRWVENEAAAWGYDCSV